jgi:hypothetical protein
MFFNQALGSISKPTISFRHHSLKNISPALLKESKALKVHLKIKTVRAVALHPACAISSVEFRFFRQPLYP